MKAKNFFQKQCRIIFLFLAVFATNIAISQDEFSTDSLMIKKVFDETLLSGESTANLEYLTSKIGARISGSKNAQRAVEWAKHKMEEIEPDTVYLQEVMVPHWVRGAKEQAYFLLPNGKQIDVDVCALGGSIGTSGVLKGEVIEVRTWEELRAIKDEEIFNRIVFFNRAMDSREIETFDSYLNAVDQRLNGAIEASKKGAVAALVRSLTLAKDDYPHTGNLNYDSEVKKIPAAALSTNSADRLSKALTDMPNLVFSLKMNCLQLPDVLSYNLIGEIKGEEYPDEVVTIGAHLDSWDLSESAVDNGAGVIQTIEALRLIKKVKPSPNRTFRAILYMNEESGAHGAKKYASLTESSNENHIALMETDAAAFAPRGFRVDAPPHIRDKIGSWSNLFVPYKVNNIEQGHRGVDLLPMKSLSKTLISLDFNDNRLFDVHHSALDTYDKINMRDVKLGSAALTSLALLILKYGF